MSPASIRVCDAAAVVDGGPGVRFAVATPSGAATGFVVRFGGVVRGYLNRCTHANVELDWRRGRFFDDRGLYLICAMHGARYAPDDGRCAGGPCAGGLATIRVVERDGEVAWYPDDAVRPPAAGADPARPMPTTIL